MAKKKKQQQKQSPEAPASSPASSAEKKLRLVTLARPRQVVAEDWSGEVPANGVVLCEGQKCFVDEVH